MNLACPGKALRSCWATPHLSGQFPLQFFLSLCAMVSVLATLCLCARRQLSTFELERDLTWRWDPRHSLGLAAGASLINLTKRCVIRDGCSLLRQPAAVLGSPGNCLALVSSYFEVPKRTSWGGGAACGTCM